MFCIEMKNSGTTSNNLCTAWKLLSRIENRHRCHRGKHTHWLMPSNSSQGPDFFFGPTSAKSVHAFPEIPLAKMGPYSYQSLSLLRQCKSAGVSFKARASEWLKWPQCSKRLNGTIFDLPVSKSPLNRLSQKSYRCVHTVSNLPSWLQDWLDPATAASVQSTL